MEWQRLKPQVTKWVMWSIKNHWMWLVVILGLQYISGEAIGGSRRLLAVMEYPRWLTIHELNSKLILIVVTGLAIEKGYLWLIRRGRI